MAVGRRDVLLGLSGSLAGLFGLARWEPARAQSPQDRFEPLDTSQTHAIFGFRHRNGLIVFFYYDLDDPRRHQFGDHSPYFFAGQTDVNTATHGIRQPTDGTSGGAAGTDRTITDYRYSFSMGAGQGSFRLHGNPLKDGLSDQLELSCPADGDGVGRPGSGGSGSAGSQAPQPLEPLTAQEIRVLSTRLRNGQIKLFQPPPIHIHFNMYELPDGRILVVTNDMSNAVQNENRAYTLDPRTRQWQEHTARYYAPDDHHPTLRAGWMTDIGFLQYQGLFVRDAIWYERHGDSFTNPRQATLIEKSSPLHNRTLKDLLSSPVSAGVRMHVTNPCILPSLS